MCPILNQDKVLLEGIIKKAVVEAIAAVYNETVDAEAIQLQKTRKEFDGDFTVVVFPLLRVSKRSPEQTGEDLGMHLSSKTELVSAFQVVKGFLNLTLSEDAWMEFFNNAVQNERYGFFPSSGKNIILEYSSPNTNKPLHLGHIRNNLLGYSVARILEANGHKVIKTQIINDRGIHICKSMLAWQKWGNGETPDSTGMKGDHLVGKYYVEFDKHYKAQVAELVEKGLAKEEAEQQASLMKEAQEMLRNWEKGDEEVTALWKKMNSWVYDGFDITYKNLGVAFDKLYYESDTWVLGKEFVLNNIGNVFYQKDDNSVWCDLSDEGLDNKLVLRKDGTAVYMTQDIGTAVKRYEDFPNTDQMIYTVGNEQEYHFKVLFKILEKLGYEWASNCYHLSYGMVELPEGKMKSREGTVVDADDLIKEMINTARETAEELGKLEDFSKEEKQELYSQIGLAALKYFILKVDPRKGMLFDPAESIDFNGNTGPFVQYAYARIQSLIKKSGKKIDPQKKLQYSQLLSEERALLRNIYYWPQVVKEAGESYSPALIANYLFDLVKEYNHFYQTVPPILKAPEDEQDFRLKLSQMVARIIMNGMNLLGAEVPSRM